MALAKLENLRSAIRLVLVSFITNFTTAAKDQGWARQIHDCFASLPVESAVEDLQHKDPHEHCHQCIKVLT